MGGKPGWTCVRAQSDLGQDLFVVYRKIDDGTEWGRAESEAHVFDNEPEALAWIVRQRAMEEGL